MMRHCTQNLKYHVFWHFPLTDKEEAINIQSLIKSAPKFCRHCDVVVLNSGVRMRKSELPYLSPDEKVTFYFHNTIIAHRLVL